MLDDRPYMRADPMRPAWTITTALIVASVAAFLLQTIYQNAGEAQTVFVRKYLALSHAGLSRGYFWQPLTFQFLHGGFFHLLLNMVCLYFFGRFLEERMGRMPFLKLYLISGVVGGLCQAALGLISKNQFGGVTVGASAGVYGLIAAFSLLEPNAIIRLWFIVPIRSIYFMYIAGGISVFYLLFPSAPGIAHAAHLGGLLAGAAYLRWPRLHSFFDRHPYPPDSGYRRRPLISVRRARAASWTKDQEDTLRDISPTDFISREVDPILDKISAKGIQSLTPQEREILEAARSKMRRR
jgi:membrane associated rhomboid family serine protease